MKYQISQILTEDENQKIGIVEINQRKCLLKEVISKDINKINMLKNEIIMYNNLKNVDFIPKIYGYKITQEEAYIVYELIEGTNLKSFVFQNFKEKVTYIIKILECVGKLHDIGIIHGDLKPSNIMIDKNNQIKLIDFGISSIGGETTFKGVGSIAYCSLEQLNKQNLNVQADLYAIGVIFYQLTNQRLPFTGTTKEIKEQKQIGTFPKTKNPLLNLIYTKSLNIDLEKRYQNAEEFINDLKLFLIE